MLPFVIYFVTGIVTALHIGSLLVVALYGIPVSPLEVVALAGSFCLLLAAYVTLYRPRAAAKIALIATFILWSFYGPAIAGRIRAGSLKPAPISRDDGRSPTFVAVDQPA